MAIATETQRMREVAVRRIAVTLPQATLSIHAKGMSATAIWLGPALTTVSRTNGTTERGIAVETRDMTGAESTVGTETGTETGTGEVTGMSRE